MTSKRYTPKTQARAVSLYKRGWPIARIARRDDMPSQGKTIRRWLRERGVTLRGNPPKYDKKKILRELNAGKKTRKEISEKYGCSLKYLSRLMQAQES